MVWNVLYKLYDGPTGHVRRTCIPYRQLHAYYPLLDISTFEFCPIHTQKHPEESKEQNFAKTLKW